MEFRSDCIFPNGNLEVTIYIRSLLMYYLFAHFAYHLFIDGNSCARKGHQCKRFHFQPREITVQIHENRAVWTIHSLFIFNQYLEIRAPANRSKLLLTCKEETRYRLNFVLSKKSPPPQKKAWGAFSKFPRFYRTIIILLSLLSSAHGKALKLTLVSECVSSNWWCPRNNTVSSSTSFYFYWRTHYGITKFQTLRVKFWVLH